MQCSHKTHTLDLTKGHRCNHKNISIRPLFTDSNKLTPALCALPIFVGNKDNFSTDIVMSGGGK